VRKPKTEQRPAPSRCLTVWPCFPGGADLVSGRGAFNYNHRTREHCPVRIRIAMKSVGPRLAIHADARTLAAHVAESPVESQGTHLRIEVHHEEAVISVFTRVQNDSATILVSGNPVRFLLVLKGDPRHFAYVGQIRNVVSCKGVCTRTVFPLARSWGSPGAFCSDPRGPGGRISVRSSFKSESRHTCTVRVSPSLLKCIEVLVLTMRSSAGTITRL
jgi:hypothetical protein